MNSSVESLRTPENKVSRRSVAKGIAWATPAAIIAATAPAYASSVCVSKLGFGGGPFYDWGVSGFGDAKTNQYLEFGGKTIIKGLPKGVTVEKIQYRFWFEQREPGTPGPGLLPLTDSHSQFSSGTFEYNPTPGSGFSSTVKQEQQGVDKRFPDGVTRKAFSVIMTWDAKTNTLEDTYINTSDGCRKFDTGPSMKPRIGFRNVVSLDKVDDARKLFHNFVEVSAVLSDGTLMENEKITRQGTGPARPSEP